MSNIAVFGMGYVGCVTAACLARDGHHVIGVDIDMDKVAELRAGAVPVVEKGLDALVKAQVEQGRLEATTDVAHAVRQTDLALISVGTPSGEDGAVRTDGVENVMRSIGAAIRDSNRPYGVVLRSTVPPGVLEARLIPALEQAAGRATGRDLWVCNNPEFLREGSAIHDYDHPCFILVGAPDAVHARAVLRLYETVQADAYITDTRTAAMVKYACNAFHALKVAFANEIGHLSRSFGADGLEVMSILCRDWKLNISPAYLRPGFAFGGSCLPKDVRALVRHAEQAGLGLELMSSLLPANEAQVRRAARMIQQSHHRKIGLVGLSFKAGTDDLRESPLVLLAETLLGRGYDLRIYDPGVMVSKLRGRNRAYVERHLPHLSALLVETPEELYAHATLLLLGTQVADDLTGRTPFQGAVLDLRRDLSRPTAPLDRPVVEMAPTPSGALAAV